MLKQAIDGDLPLRPPAGPVKWLRMNQRGARIHQMKFNGSTILQVSSFVVSKTRNMAKHRETRNIAKRETQNAKRHTAFLHTTVLEKRCSDAPCHLPAHQFEAT